MNNVARPLLQTVLYENFISISPKLYEHPGVFTSARIAGPKCYAALRAFRFAFCRTRVLWRTLSLPGKKKDAAASLFLPGGERGIRTLDGTFGPILP